MADASKFSPDGGTTILDLKDKNGRIMSEQLIRDTVGWTGKNIIPFPYLQNSGIINRGITWTYDEDGIIHANGTSSEVSLDSFIALTDLRTDIFPAGKYILTGCPAGGSSTTYWVVIYINNVEYRDYGNGVKVTINENDNCQIQCRIYRNGYVADDIDFKPMLCDERISDLTFERNHNDVTNTLKELLADAEVIEPYNVTIPYNDTSSNLFVLNSDNSITIKAGTVPAGGARFTFFNFNKEKLRDGKTYTININNVIGDTIDSTSPFVVYVNGKDSTGTNIGIADIPRSATNGFTFTADYSTYEQGYRSGIWLFPNAVIANDITVKPVLKETYIPAKDITSFIDLYKKNDSISDKTASAYGFITTSGNALILFVNLDKILANDITSFSLTKTTSTIRHVAGGYVGGSESDYTSYLNSVVRLGNQLKFEFINTSGWGVTNNTPVAGEIALTGSFS